MDEEPCRQAVRVAQDLYSLTDNADRISTVSAYLLRKTDKLITPDTRIIPAFTCRDIPDLLDMLTGVVVLDITVIPSILASNVELMQKSAVPPAHAPPQQCTRMGKSKQPDPRKVRGSLLPVKRRRMDDPATCLEDTPFAVKTYDMLPDGVLQMVYSFIPKEVTYKAMMQHRSFDLFLSKLMGYANLQSRDAAIDYYWSCDTRLIRNSISPSMAALFWAASGITCEAGDARNLRVSMGLLRVTAKKFLKLRPVLASHIHEKGVDLEVQLRMTPRFRPYFSAVGLFASTGVVEYLRAGNHKMTVHDSQNLTPLSTLISLKTLFIWPHSMDMQPLSNLINLEFLDLGDQPMADISFLASLVNLNNLILGVKVNQDLTPILRLVKLEMLYIYIWNEYTNERGKTRLGNVPVEQVDRIAELLKGLPGLTKIKFYELQTTKKDGPVTSERLWASAFPFSDDDY